MQPALIAVPGMNLPMPPLKLPLLTTVVVALCVVAWFAAGCAGDSPVPRVPIRLTVPPPATAVPTPTPAVPTPTPAVPTPAAPDPTPYPHPNTGSDIAAPAPVPELCPEHGYCDRLELGGKLTAAAWLDDDRMYLADFEGNIRLLDVTTGAVTTVLEGLSIPRGLTVLDGRLYVSEMGNVCQLVRQLPGAEQDSGCKRWPSGSEMDFFSRASAQILSYQTGDSGGLSARQVVVDRIISWDNDHAPNGLANDGEYVYASIGHPQHVLSPQGYFITHADELKAHQRRTDLMGAVARFRPPHNEVEVYATGLRNTYGISIAPDGTIYGADNDQQDGLATEGQLEELNAIVQDGFYGFPFYGTSTAPPEAGVIEPVAVLQGTVSTFAYANKDGVYVAYLAIDGSGDGFVVDRFDYDTWAPERIFSSGNLITAILERNGLLYLASFDGNVHVINPDAAPVRIRLTPFHSDGYVDKVIAAGGPSVIPPGYAVYVDAGRLIYDKDPCAPEDTEHGFFLHIVPASHDDLPEDRKQYHFDNLDFNFNAYGWRNGDRCRAVRELPDYDISIIKTGQSVREANGDFRHTWEAEYHFER